MKIHYNKEFNCFETTECHKTDNIELDGAQLIPITELEKIKAEIEDMWIKSAKDLRTGEVIYENLCEHSEVLDILNKHIFELKGEQE